MLRCSSRSRCTQPCLRPGALHRRSTLGLGLLPLLPRWWDHSRLSGRRVELHASLRVDSRSWPHAQHWQVRGHPVIKHTTCHNPTSVTRKKCATDHPSPIQLLHRPVRARRTSARVGTNLSTGGANVHAARGPGPPRVAQLWPRSVMQEVSFA